MNTLCPYCSSYSADHTGFQYNSKGANPKGQTFEMQLGKNEEKKEEPDWAHILKKKNLTLCKFINQN